MSGFDPKRTLLACSRLAFEGSRCARNAFAEGRAGLFISRINRGFGSFGRAIGMPGIEWRIWIVLDTQLDALSHGIARDFGNNAESKIDTRRDAARRDYIAVLNDPSLFIPGADQRQ